MPTRTITWNVSEIAIVVMYALVAVQALVLAYGFSRRYLMWRRGKPFGPLDNIGERLRQALAVAFIHRRLIRPGYVYAGIMHLFIFYGFIVLFIGTLIVLLEADIARPYFGFSFFNGALAAALYVFVTVTLSALREAPVARQFGLNALPPIDLLQLTLTDVLAMTAATWGGWLAGRS